MNSCTNIENNYCLKQLLTIDNKINFAIRVSIFVLTLVAALVAAKFGFPPGGSLSFPIVGFSLLFIPPLVSFIMMSREKEPAINQADIFKIMFVSNEERRKQIIQSKNIRINEPEEVAPGRKGWPILKTAASNGDEKLVRLLLELRSDIDVNQQVDSEDRIALQVALDRQGNLHEQIALLLFKKGSNLELLTDRQLLKLLEYVKTELGLTCDGEDLTKIKSELKKRELFQLHVLIEKDFKYVEDKVIEFCFDPGVIDEEILNVLIERHLPEISKLQWLSNFIYNEKSNENYYNAILKFCPLSIPTAAALYQKMGPSFKEYLKAEGRQEKIDSALQN